MRRLRFAALGAGFWSRFQLAAWRELDQADCVAICDLDRSKAERLAESFGIAAVYDDPARLFEGETFDFVDIITNVESHADLVRMAARWRRPALCQKPMAPSLAEAERMAAACRDAGTPLLVHENWRWQTPIRALKRVLDQGRVGRPFRARLDFISGFDVFKNQPFLRELHQFILTDIGSHILDVVRFLFGEAKGLMCLTDRVHGDIAGEDVATVLLRMESGATVVANMAYAGNALERERFPETFVFVEAERGSAELAPDFWVRETTAEGTWARRSPPPRYDWADPAYDVAHASLVPCLADLLQALRGEGEAETRADDNLKTLELVFSAYTSAAERRWITLG